MVCTSFATVPSSFISTTECLPFDVEGTATELRDATAVTGYQVGEAARRTLSDAIGAFGLVTSRMLGPPTLPVSAVGACTTNASLVPGKKAAPPASPVSPTVAPCGPAGSSTEKVMQLPAGP